MTELDRYYEIFKLKPGASPEMVKQAYRNLVKIWHPDRFFHDPALQRKAHERLREINEAYERLQTFHSEAFQARPQSGPFKAGRSKMVRKPKVVWVSAVSVLLVFVISIRWLNRFAEPGKAANPEVKPASIPVDEKMSLQELRAEGRKFFSVRDYRRALPYFQEAIKKNPRHAKTWYQVGYCNYKLGHYREAASSLQETIRLNPGYVKAYYSLGRTYGKQKRFQDAISAFQQAIRIKPEYADAHRELALMYAKERRFLDAVEALKQAIRVKPNDASLYYSLARMYLRIGDRDAN
jgi:tetratricopeptide (TPR) repeat protein